MRLFHLDDRGLIRVTGADRVRWLDGMVSNDIAALSAGPERSGCYALVLTRQGRIVADPHVLLRGDEIWLELASEAVAPAIEALDKLIVADDVGLEDHSAAVERLALEGPEAAAAVAPELAPDSCGEVELGGARGIVAAYGLAGPEGRQFFFPPGQAEEAARALAALGAEPGEPELLERLRIEAGVPRFGAELGTDVLPAEARLLERAVSNQKGCFIGQEVVERMRSRGQVGHLLVRLASEAGFSREALELPLVSGGKKVGEVTSVAGALALGYVRRQHAEPGTRLDCAGQPVRVL